MARAIQLELPVALSADEVHYQIRSLVESLLRKQGNRMSQVTPEVQDNIIPVAVKQITAAVRRDHNIVWNVEANRAHVLIDPEDLNEDGQLSEDEANKVVEQSLKEMAIAVNSAAHFVAGGIISLLGLNRSV